jgi:site-specific DNA-methyltransferase (adenine-specific)
VVSVKGDIRDLKGTMEREKAALGLFLPSMSRPVRWNREAAAAGVYETGGVKSSATAFLRKR